MNPFVVEIEIHKTAEVLGSVGMHPDQLDMSNAVI